MGCFLYARKSTDDKERQVQSLPDQIRILNELAQQRSFTITDTIEDSKSAKEPGRAGFNAMVARIEGGEADSILCWSMDRLSRNPIDGGRIMWLLQKGILKSIVTPERTYLPEDSSILLSVETGRSTDYVRKLSADVKRGMKSKIQQGWMPGKAPIGYRNEKEGVKGQKRILPSDLFEPIQHLWKHILRERCSLADLYRYMGASCPIYVHGKHLAFSTFCRVFRNTFYAGYFYIHGERHQGAHLPMISESEFAEVQSILDGTFISRKRKHGSPFSKLIRCGSCGAWVTPEFKVKWVKALGGYTIYGFVRCVHRKQSNPPCREKPLSESAVRAFILSEIEAISLPSDFIEFGLRKLAKEKQQNVPTLKEQQLTRELQSLQKGLKIMQRNIAFAPDSETQAVVMSELKSAKTREQEITQELEKEKKKRLMGHDEIRDSLQVIQRARHLLENGSIEEQRHTIHVLGSDWRMANKSLDYEPNLIPAAIKKTKERFHLKSGMFGPLKSQSATGETCSLDQAEIIWSG